MFYLLENRITQVLCRLCHYTGTEHLTLHFFKFRYMMWLANNLSYIFVTCAWLYRKMWDTVF